MKNIKIVTFSRAHNYGALLQCYALSQFLKNAGYNVSVLDYRCKPIDNKYKLLSINESPKIVLEKIYRLIRYPKMIISRYVKFQRFIKRKLSLTKSFKKVTDLNDIITKDDILITGSDQVWNHKVTNGLDDVYTLNFDLGRKRISYAASTGSLDFLMQKPNDYKTKLSKLNSISVREKDIQKSMADILNKEVTTVLDPSLLLTKKEWEDKINDNIDIKEDFILSYMLERSEDYLKIVNDLSNKTGLKVVHFGVRNSGYNSVMKCMNNADPFEFVSLIKHAKYVVTTSFHATVFSIIFNKKFWVLPPKITGARITDLLDIVDLNNRAVSSFEDFEKNDYNAEIDYKKVNEKLDKERKKSIDWLINAIEK